MTTFTNSKLTDENVSNATLIRLILWAEQHNSHYVVAALRELQERRKADSVPVEVNDDMAYAFHHALSDSSLGADEVEEIKTGLRAAFANIAVQPALIVPHEWRLSNAQAFIERYSPPSVEEAALFAWNACRAAMLQAEPVSNSDELPLDYLQGHKDGLEWAAQLAEANHPQTGDWLYDDPIDLARAIRKGPDMPTVQGGNSPVTPDGWISCSERMPEMGERQCYVLAADFKNNYPPNIPNTQVGVYGDWFNDGNPTWDDGDGEDLYLKEVTHWMPLPEPPQEVNRG